MPEAICPICSGYEQNYLFTVLGSRVLRCSACGFVRMSQENLGASLAERGDWAGYETEADAAERYASTVSQLCPAGKVLLICEGPHPLGQALRTAGLEVSYSASNAFYKQKGAFAGIVFLGSLERLEDPKAAMEHAYSLMDVGGLLFIATPSLDSRAARFFGRSWVHWRSKNANYFNRTTIQLLLERTGFGKIWLQPDRRIFALDHVVRRLHQSNFKFASKMALSLYRVLPKGISHHPMRFSTSGLLVTAMKTARKEQTTLSVIMPVYNELPTVAAALSAVLEKQVAGIDRKEIVLVESNSTDGTRDVVRSFEGREGLKIVYEDLPRGKGHAVRTGLQHATGDIVLIQDADTEYDINDYDELLEPIMRWRQVFVLGSRHQGDWKMRTFTDNPALSTLFNFGQLFFTWLMNTLYQQNMTDPFTMYKVFRRECLFGLSFECNRFDFDHELVIKFLRKGYRPLELPVNYCSRSYSQGKKVTIIGDPLLWIKANFKYRFVSPFKPMREAYREARKELKPDKPRVKSEASAFAFDAAGGVSVDRVAYADSAFAGVGSSVAKPQYSFFGLETDGDEIPTPNLELVAGTNKTAQEADFPGGASVPPASDASKMPQAGFVSASKTPVSPAEFATMDATLNFAIDEPASITNFDPESSDLLQNSPQPEIRIAAPAKHPTPPEAS